MRKRTYAKSASRTRSKSTVKRQKVVAPKAFSLAPGRPARTNSYHCQLRYAENYALNPSVAGFAAQVFASNGLFDVDITGVGHQPAGFDQLMALWNEYVVLKARIKVSFTSQDANNYSTIFGVTHADFATALTDWRQYVENGSTKWGKQAGRGAEPLVIVMEIDMAQWSHQDIFNDDNYTGNVSSNPTDTHNFHIWTQTDGNVDAGNFYATVEITYDVVFRDTSQVALS